MIWLQVEHWSDVTFASCSNLAAADPTMNIADVPAEICLLLPAVDSDSGIMSCH